MTKSLYTQAIIHVNTILNHIAARAILARYEGFCMVYNFAGASLGLGPGKLPNLGLKAHLKA